MSLRSRLDAAHAALGLDDGPTEPCPRCDGTGVDDSEAQLRARLPQRLAEMWARFGPQGVDHPIAARPVKGQWFLPIGGQWNCPSVAIRIVH